MNKKMMLALLAGTLAGALAAAAQEAAGWYDSVKVKGDVRYRYENVDDETRDAERQRDRIRVRAGVFADAGDDLDIGVQLTTSTGGDPISGNQTLGEYGSKKEVNLDLGYLDYHPEALGGLSLIAGKMNNPYLAVADNVFDGDYNPEGLAATFKTGDGVEFLANAGYHWLDERGSDEDDGKQYGVQAAAKVKGENKAHLLAGVGYYATENLEGQALFEESAFGNSTVTVTDEEGAETELFASEYEVVEGFAEVGAHLGLPVKGYGSYTVNQDADDDDTGYLLGVTLGKAKDPNSYELGYNWRDLEKDAVLGALTDSDSGGGGTNLEGHKFFAKYQISKALQAGVTYYMNNKDPDGKDTDYDRLQIDFTGKF